jgi:hypothetical protein
MTLKQLRPHRSETQDWERSAERNPAAASRQRLIERRDQIRRGDGDKANAVARFFAGDDSLSLASLAALAVPSTTKMQ